MSMDYQQELEAAKKSLQDYRQSCVGGFLCEATEYGLQQKVREIQARIEPQNLPSFEIISLLDAE